MVWCWSVAYSRKKGEQRRRKRKEEKEGRKGKKGKKRNEYKREEERKKGWTGKKLFETKTKRIAKQSKIKQTKKTPKLQIPKENRQKEEEKQAN